MSWTLRTSISSNYASGFFIHNLAVRVLAAKTTDSLALVDNDGAVGDPASIGVAVLLANWTKSDLNNTAYSTAAGGQLDYLLNVAPRTGKSTMFVTVSRYLHVNLSSVRCHLSSCR